VTSEPKSILNNMVTLNALFGAIWGYIDTLSLPKMCYNLYYYCTVELYILSFILLVERLYPMVFLIWQAWIN